MSARNNAQDEIVQVPVPRMYLEAVYRALADAAAPKPEPGSAIPSPKELTQRAWTADEISRFKARNPYGVAATIMDLACAEVGRRVPLDEVERVADMPHTKARGQLGGLTKFLKREFHRTNWPFGVTYDTLGHALYYVTSNEIAKAWREA